jgi:uncharacterized protein
VDPVAIIERCYTPGSLSHRILLEHGRLVAQKALAAAARVPHLSPDLAFVEAAAMLNDIGIFLTCSPALGCAGKEPYIRHGILGRRLLDAIGLPRHGLVCERHVGAGISREDIRRHRLPLPARDMLPLSIEEQIICFADKFYSKNGDGRPSREKSVEGIMESLRPHGEDKAERFREWAALFA